MSEFRGFVQINEHRIDVKPGETVAQFNKRVQDLIDSLNRPRTIEVTKVGKRGVGGRRNAKKSI